MYYVCSKINDFNSNTKNIISSIKNLNKKVFPYNRTMNKLHTINNDYINVINYYLINIIG